MIDKEKARNQLSNSAAEWCDDIVNSRILGASKQTNVKGFEKGRGKHREKGGRDKRKANAWALRDGHGCVR